MCGLYRDRACAELCGTAIYCHPKQAGSRCRVSRREKSQPGALARRRIRIQRCCKRRRNGRRNEPTFRYGAQCDQRSGQASDPTTPEGTEESAPPPEFTREELSAVIASVLPSEIGAFRPGSGSVDTDGEPGYVRISQCELDSAVPTACDISVVTAEVLMYWTDSYGWELESIRFDGNARLGIEGKYTISSFGLTQSANVTIGPYATIDSDGSLVFQNVAIQCGDYMTETSLTVEVIDHPENMVATKESGSVYRGNTPDNKFSLYFDADMKPIFFAYDP